MIFSRHNLLAPVPGSDRRLLLNRLRGVADLLEPGEATAFEAATAAGDPERLGDLEPWRRRGYLIDDPAAEAADLARAYADFLDAAAREPTQLVLVPTYACDLGCDYCLQAHLRTGGGKGGGGGAWIGDEVLARFFDAADRLGVAPGREAPYVTLYGGEPLLDLPEAERVLRGLLAGAARRGWGVAVVTHGAHLVRHADALAAGGVREVQVTLDGPAEVHDARRPFRAPRDGSTATFHRIADGVDALLARGVPVNLRVVVDRDNLERLPELAAFAQRRGWIDHPPERFKTQVARNYELYACDPDGTRILDRVALWSRYADLAAEHPALHRFHRPLLAGMRILAETGALPPPLFDACPAAKREWAFDLQGGIWGCTATVGRDDLRLGAFHPEFRLEESAVEPWEGRDVLSIPECAGCAAALVCGGGCGAVALERTGRVRAPECRPAAALCALGVRHYRLGSEPT